MFFTRPKSPPNAPNSEEPLPGFNLVVFAYVYIFPHYQNYPLHAPPSLPAHTASQTPYPAPINIPHLVTVALKVGVNWYIWCLGNLP